MKTVDLSNATFGLLWSLAVEADQTEEDILRRVLGGQRRGVAASAGNITGAAHVAGVGGTAANNTAPGFTDPRYGVKFPEGISIFRTYLGKSYTAQVFQGKWIIAEMPGKTFTSLNALNKAVGADSENAWYSWYYRDANTGKRERIGALRDPDSIKKRAK